MSELVELWRLTRRENLAVCVVEETSVGLAFGVHVDGELYYPELFDSVEELLRRSTEIELGLRAKGWSVDNTYQH